MTLNDAAVAATADAASAATVATAAATAYRISDWGSHAVSSHCVGSVVEGCVLLFDAVATAAQRIHR